MQYPTLSQLAKMTPEQRTQRLRGLPAPARERLVLQAAELLANIHTCETSKPVQ